MYAGHGKASVYTTILKVGKISIPIKVAFETILAI